jgi:integrase
MIKLSIILDTRRANNDGLYPIKLRIGYNRSAAMVATGCFASENAFVGSIEQVVTRTFPQSAAISRKIRQLYVEYSDMIYEIERDGKFRNATAAHIKEQIETLLNADSFAETTFTEEMEKYIGNCRAKKTADGYRYAYALVHEFMRKKKIYFEDLTFNVLTNFDRWMEKRGMVLNSRSIIFRYVRAVFNFAIKSDLVQPNVYPFHKFSIKKAKVDKDYLTIQEFQELLALDLHGQELLARDYFLLSFYLCGINPTDLFNLLPPDKKEMVSFVRQKIAPKSPPTIHLYIHACARVIIDKYRGEKHLLYFAEKYTYETFLRRIDRNLKAIGNKLGKHLYMYLARDTWATYADQIGIPHEVISKALGHTDSSTAEKYYISFDWTKVHKANKQVIDYVYSTSSTC